jgi:hypothetical protein
MFDIDDPPDRCDRCGGLKRRVRGQDMDLAGCTCPGSRTDPVQSPRGPAQPQREGWQAAGVPLRHLG